MPVLSSLSPELAVPTGGSVVVARADPADATKRIFDLVSPAALGDAQAAMNAANAVAIATAANTAVSNLSEAVNSKQATIPAGTGLLAQTTAAGAVRAIAVGANLNLSGDTLSAANTGVPTTRIITAPGPVTVLASDNGGDIIIAKTTAQATAVQLIAAAPRLFVATTAGAETLPTTVLPPAGATIWGDANFVLNVSRERVMFVQLTSTLWGAYT